MNEQSKETGEIFERSINKKQWSRERSRKIGVHWIFQARKPKDARVEGLNPSNPSKQRIRNWYRGACMMCGRSVDTKCQQCRVWLCIDLRSDIYMQQRIPYLAKLRQEQYFRCRRWIRRGGRGRRGRLSEFEGSDIFEREIKYLLTKECNSIFLRTFYLSKFCEPFG